MIINHNMSSITAYRNVTSNSAAQAKSMEKLSTGLRINRAADDAAGLSISEKMRGQIRGLDQAQRNAQDGVSMIQTAEGGLNETHAILQRMRELAVQGRNDTNTAADRTALNDELTALRSEIDNIAKNTQYNTQTLLAGNASKKFQIGANKGQVVTVQFGINTAGAGGLNISNVSLGNATAAANAISSLDQAISKVSARRSQIGAIQNRLEYSINNLSTSSENLTAAESRVRDVDMAKEVMKNSKNNILSQAAQAMLSQANQQPQNVLQLLR